MAMIKNPSAKSPSARAANKCNQFVRPEWMVWTDFEVWTASCR
jgi:hypothetical protein